MDKMEPDYKKLGLKVGFEIHQELDTHKLFCNCPSKLREEDPAMHVRRRLRPTQSEMGEVDRAALAESVKGKGFSYQLYPDSVCLVELDEEPPHPVNGEALDITLEAAMLLNAGPVDEVHVMRKTVIDGSNTSGFQRTMLVATDGRLDVDGKSFKIQTVCLEEDAARKIGESAHLVDYRLDRLGIPLIEIATGPDFHDPVSPAKAALYIGRLLRATDRMKRGIGTIRQDVNISIAKGARQEIKGVQELGLISVAIEREVQRQLALLEIKDELKRRGAGRVDGGIVDVTEIFSKSGSKVVARSIASGGKVLALKLEKFAGLLGMELQPGRRFGTELSDRAKIYGKVGGLFHTDEMPAYGISPEEIGLLKSRLGASEEDAVVFIADARAKAEAALKAVVDRASEALDGVPEEVRRALADGNTEYMRPLPGASRMYPETDIPPIPVTSARLRSIKGRLSDTPEKRRAKLAEKYGLSQDLAEQMSLSENLKPFEEVVRRTGADPTLVATTLESTLVGLRREGVKVDVIGQAVLEEVFAQVAEGSIVKEAVPDVLRLAAQGLRLGEIIEKLGLAKIGANDLEELAAKVVSENRKLIEERGLNAVAPLMGILMAKVRGKVDGKLVHEVLEREIKKIV